jgi:hypothetical protein
MPEILGDVPRWFDPERPDQLAAALAPFMNDPRRVVRWAERAPHAAQFHLPPHGHGDGGDVAEPCLIHEIHEW